VETDPAGVDAPSMTSTLHLGLPLLTLVVGSVLPALTALVTNRFASSTVKTLVLAVLSVVTAAAEQAVANGGDIDVAAFATTALVQFILAVAVHHQVTKPVGLTGGDGAIARAIPGGLGAPTEPFEV
jgi:hypothetical protein